jgi:glycosyltransferase 2 family protein
MIRTLWRHSLQIMHQPRWQRGGLALMLLAGIGIALWTVARDWSNLVSYQWHFDWVYLALSSVAYIGALALAMLAWGGVMHALSARLTWKQHSRFYIYSWMARRLPTAAPFVASRVMLYEQAGVARRLTLSGMLWEQILQLASGGVLVILMFPFTPLLRDSIPLLPVVLVALVSVFLALRPATLTHMINWLLRRWGKEPLTNFLGLPTTLTVFALHTLLWLIGSLILFLMVRSIYVLDWSLLPVVVQVWVVTGLVGALSFLIPVGLGLSDVSMAVLLALVVPLSVALIIVLLIRVWISLHELFWALVFSRL